MNAKMQAGGMGRPRYAVGVDAHSRKLAISVWEGSDPWSPTPFLEIRSCGIDAMERTFERHVPLDSIVVIEASTNSRSLRNRLVGIGFRAEVVRADAVRGRERRRKVCDIQDARSLALACLRGELREFVWTPSDEYAEYRDIHFAYRDTVKELTRTSNRIWSVCSQRGPGLPIRAGATKAASVRRMVAESGVAGFARDRLEMLVRDYEFMLERRHRLDALMAEAVLGNDAMLGLMQLPGFYIHGAFVLQALVEDPRRFPSAARLAAYAGLSPTADTSGEEEERARRRGGTGKPLDGDGRHDLKYYCCEAGQTVLHLCPKSSVGKWGWAMASRGKPRNKVVCAVGHKLVTYAWHIMRGDPTPNRDGEAMFRRKMMRLYSQLGKRRMRELGHPTRAAFADAMAERFYGALPKAGAGPEA